MPAISSRFNRFLLILLIQFKPPAAAAVPEPALAETQWQWLAERVYRNECAGREACLTSWNEGEEFPSLGIGHFIWYPAGYDGPFVEAFPGLLRHLEASAVDIPDWLAVAADSGAPWSSREQFYAEYNSPKMGQLRRLLASTQREQVEYIVHKFFSSLPDIQAWFPTERQKGVGATIAELAASAPPHGLYALIDYVHFKGTGLSPEERYGDQGWGLAQVLETMNDLPTEGVLERFIEAAERVLARRVENSPPERNERRWLEGWHRRLQTYRPPVQ